MASPGTLLPGHAWDHQCPGEQQREVWFTGAGKTGDSFTYHVDKATANWVLILADRTTLGTSNFPAYPAGDLPAVPSRPPTP
jgi:hypothetical protein